MFTKTALRFAAPLDVLAYRFTASLAALAIPILSKRIPLSYRNKNLWPIWALAVLYPIAFFALQTFGLVHATSSEGGILLAVTPVFTMILSGIFLKENTSPHQKASLLLSVAGVIYIFLMKGAGLDPTEVLGISLLLLAALVSAGYHILNRLLLRQFTLTEISFMMTLLGFVFFNLLALTRHVLAGDLGHFFAPLLQGEFLMAVVYLGILSSLVSSLLNSYVLSKIEAAKVSVFGNLRTVVTILAGVYFLQEPFYLYHLAGSLMIILGVIGTNYNKPIRPKPLATRNKDY